MPKSHRMEKPGLRTKLLTPGGLSVYTMHNKSLSVSDWYVYACKQIITLVIDKFMPLANGSRIAEKKILTTANSNVMRLME